MQTLETNLIIEEAPLVEYSLLALQLLVDVTDTKDCHSIHYRG